MFSRSARWRVFVRQAVNALGKTVVALNASFVRLESLLNEIYGVYVASRAAPVRAVGRPVADRAFLSNNESVDISRAKKNKAKEDALAAQIADLQARCAALRSLAGLG
jgi:hypothetical protein